MINERIHIETPLEEVFNMFAQIDRWNRNIPEIKGTEGLYEDERHQEFLMTVERNGQDNSARVIRFLEPRKRIDFFHAQPGPGLSVLRGRWTFNSSDGGTDVEADFTFALSSERKGEENAVATDIAGFLRKNLARTKEYLEGEKR